MVKDPGGDLAHLLNKEQRAGAVAVGKGGIGALQLRVAEPHRDHRLQRGNAHALLERADHDQVSEMIPVVSLFGWCRHDLLLDVVVDHGGGDAFVIKGGIGGKVPFEQRQDLIHIKIKVGEIVPFWKSSIGKNG